MEGSQRGPGMFFFMFYLKHARQYYGTTVQWEGGCGKLSHIQVGPHILSTHSREGHENVYHNITFQPTPPVVVVDNFLSAIFQS